MPCEKLRIFSFFPKTGFAKGILGKKLAFFPVLGSFSPSLQRTAESDGGDLVRVTATLSPDDSEFLTAAHRRLCSFCVHLRRVQSLRSRVSRVSTASRFSRKNLLSVTFRFTSTPQVHAFAQSRIDGSSGVLLLPTARR